MSSDPQGTRNSANRHQFIVRTLVFVFHGEQVLLLKGAPHKRLWANRYNGIGGHVEQGESILASARREIYEEVGLNLPQLDLRGIITIDPNTNPGMLLFLFTAVTSSTAVQASSEGTPEWVDWHTLAPESMVEDLPVLLNRLSQMQPSDPPFYAHYTYNPSGNLSIHFTD